MSKINDFGQKIGGARKDFYKDALNLNDLENMNEAEKKKIITKDNVWPKPNYQKLYDDGMDKRIVYFIKTVRDACPCKPKFVQYQEHYVTYLTQIKEMAENIEHVIDIENFYKKIEARFSTQKSSYYRTWNEGAGAVIDRKFQRKLCWLTLDGINRGIRKDMFLYTQDQKDLTSYLFFNLNDDRISFTESAEGKLGITFTLTYPDIGSYTYYTNLEFSKKDEFEKGKWFSYCKGDKGIWAINCESKEEAQNVVLEAIHKLREAVPKTETVKKKGKTAFIPTRLLKCDRVGKAYLAKDYTVTGDDMIGTFNFKGGEYGNWLNDDTRQENLNQSYLAFADLARAINISANDISFNQELSIAFGARGHSSAVAHYEPERKVINLTKLKGAGSLAHEWGHALDNYLGYKQTNAYDRFLTETSNSLIQDVLNAMKFKILEGAEAKIYYQNLYKQRKHDFIEGFKNFNLFNDKFNDEAYNYVSECLDKLVDMKVCLHEDVDKLFKDADYINKPERFRNYVLDRVRKLNLLWLNAHKNDLTIKVETDYFLGSQYFDNRFSKTGHKDYWSSDVELFARAFSCYVKDKLGQDKNDYLCAHSDCYSLETSNGTVYAYPRGEERKVINEAFDKLISDAKKMGYLHSFNEVEVNLNKPEEVTITSSLETPKEIVKEETLQTGEESYEQMSLFNGMCYGEVAY